MKPFGAEGETESHRACQAYSFPHQGLARLQQAIDRSEIEALRAVAANPFVKLTVLVGGSFRQYAKLETAASVRHSAGVSAHEIIEQLKSLAAPERAKVADYLLHKDTSWIPEDFRAAMADLAEGRLVDMETVLRETPPSDLR